MLRVLILVLITSLSFHLTAASGKLSPALFAQQQKYFAAKISPGGDYLAVGMMSEQQRKLVVLDTNTFRPVGGASFPGGEQVGNFFWATDERIVIEIARRMPWMEMPVNTGELYAIDYDGDDGELLYGNKRRGGVTGGTSSKIKKDVQNTGWAEVIDPLPDDEDFILIANYSFFGTKDSKPTIHKLDIDSGRLRNEVTRAPLPKNKLITDSDGNIRYAFGQNDENENVMYQYDLDKDSWSEFSPVALGSDFYPLGLDEKNEILYFLNNHETDTQGLYKYQLKEQKVVHVYTNEDVDITDTVYSVAADKAYAVRIDDGYPEYLVFNKSVPEAQLFKSILATFPGQEVTLTSATRDGNKWVIQTSSDTSPRTFYLYDKEANNIAFLFKALDNIPEKQMALTEAVQFEARDGHEISGYLTKLRNASKPMPLVTLIHGGPHGVRDYWGYDREAQLLASQGYAVLQVNFRGSGGYGHKFEAAGYHQWGALMQYDIIDGTRWAAAQDDISDEKLCVMGASFGGYSAMQSSLLAPELFECTVANVGVYDLEMMFDKGDIPKSWGGEAFLKMVLGNDASQLQAYSPVHNVEKLQSALFIAHGENDYRVPIEQAEALRDALDEIDKDYEWFVKDYEAHGFYNPDNRAEYFEKVATFLAKHLK